MTDMERYRLLVLQKRLQMELNFPEWASSPTSRYTMMSANSLEGVKGRTRKDALAFVTNLLEVT